MAELLASSLPEKSNTARNLLVAAVLLTIAAAAGLFFFYHHENHADVEGTVVRVLPLPVHTRYAHIADTVGPDPETDSLYLVAVVRLRDRSYAPLFLKDINGDLRLDDGRLAAGNRVRVQDMDRLLTAVPQLRPVLAQAGGKPLQPEQTVAPNTTAEGYVVFEYNFPQKLWDTRKGASVTVDFYHQEPLRMAISQ